MSVTVGLPGARTAPSSQGGFFCPPLCAAMNKVGIDTGHAGMNRIHCQIRTGPLWDQNTLIHPPPPPKHPPINFFKFCSELITGAFSDRLRRGNSDLNARRRQLSSSCYAHFAGNLFQTSFYDLGLARASLYTVQTAFLIIIFELVLPKKEKVGNAFEASSAVESLSSRSLSAEYSL